MWQVYHPSDQENPLLEGPAEGEHTPCNGELRINVLIDPFRGNSGPYTSNDQLLLKVKVQKVTGTGSAKIIHRFLCYGEKFPCPNDGVSIFISHLSFQQVAINDATFVPFEGSLYIGQYSNGKASSTSCILPNVKVCLMKKIDTFAVGEENDIPFWCNTTRSNGAYTLYSLIGSSVYPKVFFPGHNFVPMSAYKDLYATGIYISVEANMDGILRDHDFYDATFSDLIVEVAGGLCNKTLGYSTIAVKLNACSKSLYEQKFIQTEWNGIYKVPSHVVDGKREKLFFHLKII